MTRNGCYRLALWGLGLLLAYTLVSLGTFLFRGEVDFPFFLAYDSQTKVISFRHNAYQTTEAITPRIQAFFDVYYANYGGMGPHYEESNSDKLHVDTLAGALRLERDGDNLLVNGQRLLPGQPHTCASYWHLHPWLKARLQLKNLGLVTIEHIPDSKPRLAVHGTYGTVFAPEKGSLLTLVLGGLMTYVLWKRRHLPQVG
jgi:hypothetical protein